MQDSSNLLETLADNNYFLMTNEDGSEIYDELGHLLFYQSEGGNCLSIPNSEEVRRLYDLPLNAPEKINVIKSEDVRKPGNVLCIPDQSDQTVWVGQKTPHSIKATKKLIELYRSPKYQELIRNRNTYKLKVWEQIASELQENGFKIASNAREAGLRTFQKWRNMERTYWKFMKANPDDSGEDRRKRKPYFFDDLHEAINKRTELSNSNEGGNTKHDEEDEDEDDTCSRLQGGLKRKRVSDEGSNDGEAFPREALSLLMSLVTSPTYEEFLKETPQQLNNKTTKVWENIYKDMMKEGWRFGKTVKEGALILSGKWRMLERTILRRKLCGQRTMYTSTFRKALLMEIETRNLLGPSYIRDCPSPSEFLIPSRKPKVGEIELEVVKVLLKLLDSDHYQTLMTKNEGKRSKLWDTIFEDINSRGYEIPGASRQEKVSRLFQKWRNMKRGFVKYIISKSMGREVRKPMFYELLFSIISKDILNRPISDSDSDDEEEEEEEEKNEWDEDLESEDTLELLELTQIDHDYGQPRGASNDSDDGRPLSHPSTHCTVEEPVQPKASTSRTSRSHQVLQQIKSLQEASLAMQQQNFSKIISLLENQISVQNKLTSVISDFVQSQTKKSNSKNGQMKLSGHSKTTYKKTRCSINNDGNKMR